MRVKPLVIRVIGRQRNMAYMNDFHLRDDDTGRDTLTVDVVFWK